MLPCNCVFLCILQHSLPEDTGMVYVSSLAFYYEKPLHLSVSAACSSPNLSSHESPSGKPSLAPNRTIHSIVSALGAGVGTGEKQSQRPQPGSLWAENLTKALNLSFLDSLSSEGCEL